MSSDEQVAYILHPNRTDAEIAAVVRDNPYILNWYLRRGDRYVEESTPFVRRLLPFVNINLEIGGDYLIHELIRDNLVELAMMVVKDPRHNIRNDGGLGNSLQLMLYSAYSIASYHMWFPSQDFLEEYIRECIRRGVYMNQADLLRCAEMFFANDELLGKCIAATSWSWQPRYFLPYLVDSLVSPNILRSVMWHLGSRDRVVQMEERDWKDRTAADILRGSNFFTRNVRRMHAIPPKSSWPSMANALAAVLVEYGMSANLLTIPMITDVARAIGTRHAIRTWIIFDLWCNADWRISRTVLACWPTP
jgi:hypothetical protein